MQLYVSNPILQTILFSIVLIGAILLTLKKRNEEGVLGLETTTELKGYSMLAIVFSHVGYFLSANSQFLFPLSIAGGIAVNFFFLLSGFGLTVSMLKNEAGALDFYKRRFMKIIIPLWLTLIAWYILDFFILHISYSVPSIIQSFFGMFSSSDIFHAVNSSLWFITPLFFFYLLFPLVVRRSHPYRSALLMGLFAFIFMKLLPHADQGIESLYGVHWASFPLGIMLAQFVSKHESKIREWVSGWRRYAFSVLLLAAFAYLLFHTAVGTPSEQWVSLVAVAAGIFAFITLPLRSRFVRLVGVYSFEIYLLHWPLFYRYGFWFKAVPPWIGLIIGFALLLAFSKYLRFLTEKVSGFLNALLPRFVIK